MKKITEKEKRDIREHFATTIGCKSYKDEILVLSRDNPIINQCLQPYLTGQIAWETCMEIMVIALVEACKNSDESLIKYVKNGPPSTVIVVDDISKIVTSK